MLSWLEAQLIDGLSKGTKFIITDHVYAGARYHGSTLWHDEFNSRYFQILRDYHEAVAFEVVGHDHYGDLRYHSSYDVLDLPDTDTKFDFHNLFIAPGITPNKNQNPGVAMFEMDAYNTPHSLKFEFVDINPLLGKTSATYNDLKFLSLDMAKDFGVTSLTPDDLKDFRNALEDSSNYDWAMDYLVRKMGFDANNSAEFD